MEINNKTTDLIAKVLKKYDEIELPADGTSMYPFIREGDICTFTSCDPSSLKKGDVVLFKSQRGQLVAHRFIQTETIQRKHYYLFKGDTNLGFDDPVCEEDIIGKLAVVKRNNMKFSSSNITSNLWSKTILTFPIISYWLRLYINRRNTLQY